MLYTGAMCAPPPRTSLSDSPPRYRFSSGRAYRLYAPLAPAGAAAGGAVGVKLVRVAEKFGLTIPPLSSPVSIENPSKVPLKKTSGGPTADNVYVTLSGTLPALFSPTNVRRNGLQGD